MNDCRATQRSRILEILRTANGREVPLPAIAAIAAQYNARVYELRRMGYRITNRRQRMADGALHTWFKLESSPTSEVQDNEVNIVDPMSAAPSQAGFFVVQGGGA